MLKNKISRFWNFLLLEYSGKKKIIINFIKSFNQFEITKQPKLEQLLCSLKFSLFYTDSWEDAFPIATIFTSLSIGSFVIFLTPPLTLIHQSHSVMLYLECLLSFLNISKKNSICISRQAWRLFTCARSIKVKVRGMIVCSVHPVFELFLFLLSSFAKRRLSPLLFLEKTFI